MNSSRGLKNRDLYKRIFVITIPIVIQNLLNAAVNSMDVLMLNFVGQSSLSAASLATQYASIFFMLYYGLGTGVSMLGAQYWGKGDVKTIEKVEGIALRFSLSFGVLMTLCSLCIPQLMMKVFTNDPEIIMLGARYLRICGVSYLFWSVSAIYLSVLRCVGRVSISTAMEAVALVGNVILNATFIFGWFGLPKMGIVGVALATTLSRIIQFFICIAVSAKSKNVKIRIKPVFEKHPALFKDFLTMSVPAVLNDVIWSIGFSMYSVVLGHLGSDVVAANSIVTVVRNLGCVFCFGIGSASGIVIGQILGENKIEEAKKASHTFLRLAAITGVMAGLIIFIISPFAISFAKISETAMKYLSFMLKINIYYCMGTAINSTLIAGVFRAGGDSKFGFICDLIDIWVYAVPLGFLSAFVFKWPVEVVYVLLCTDEFVKWPWVFKHYYSYKWAKNITRESID